jgi:hypothetical protein
MRMISAAFGRMRQRKQFEWISAADWDEKRPNGHSASRSERGQRELSFERHRGGSPFARQISIKTAQRIAV